METSKENLYSEVGALRVNTEREILPVHLFLHLFSSEPLSSSRDKIFVQRETQPRRLILLTLIKHNKQNKKTQQQIEELVKVQRRK